MSRSPRRRQTRRSLASMPMAPMIDMVFLLLVFFMTASAMSQASARREVDLPEAPSGQVPQDLSDRLIVSVDDEGAFYLSGSAIDAAALEKTVAAAREQKPRLKLAIRADRSAPFRSVKELMRLAAGLGVESYVYATYQNGE